MEMDSLSGIEGTKVLLIDDDPLIGECMMPFLADKGIQLTSCQTLGEAVEATKACCYDILICDQYLLKDDAENTFDLLKNTVPPMLRVVFTGPVGVDSFTEAKMEGTHAFIPKPFSAGAIIDVLHGYLQKRSKN
jgi:DNA-binding NtrC family response regulator